MDGKQFIRPWIDPLNKQTWKISQPTTRNSQVTTGNLQSATSRPERSRI
jgi:hypothetical protein